MAKVKLNTLSLLNDSKYFDESGTKFAEMRKMLDSRDMKIKLDAMKRLSAMMTIGRDVSSFFPDVVKCIITDNIEVKKLVYHYLTFYAEQNPELALLSIASLQKDMANHSQRVRANALKAMSSIRLPVVVPLVVHALNTAIKDTSVYVKRAAASAITKVFALDTKGDQTEILVGMVVELLSSNDPQILSSAIFAFQQLCPTRYDLLHPHFRKICRLLADLDEWGQTLTLDILLRYSRTQFLSPFKLEQEDSKEIEGDTLGTINASGGGAKSKPKDKKDKFYSDDEEESNESKSADAEQKEIEAQEKKHAEYLMDPDLRLLLKSASLLLYSRNAAVIQGVATLFFNLASAEEMRIARVARAMVFATRTRPAMAYVLLANISTFCDKGAIYKNQFRPHLKSFYVNSTDPVFVKELKIDIMAKLASDSNISAILKEFQCYVKDSDKQFVSNTVKAIGRCAAALPTISERCMRGLLLLVSSPTPSVVAEAVIVIRQLLQADVKAHSSVVRRMSKLVDTVTVPSARTAIVWIIGEYREYIPRAAPDCLRKLAKSFTQENETVKEQILNLAVKLFLSNPLQTSLLFKYIMELAKTDASYDIRDQARLARALFFKKKKGVGSSLGTQARDQLKQCLLSIKPAPRVEVPFEGRARFLAGSMSHLLNFSTNGYEALPEFPLVAPENLRTSAADDEDSKKRRPSRSRSLSRSRSRDHRRRQFKLYLF